MIILTSVLTCAIGDGKSVWKSAYQRWDKIVVFFLDIISRSSTIFVNTSPGLTKK